MSKIKEMIAEHKGFVQLAAKSAIYVLLMSVFVFWGPKLLKQFFWSNAEHPLKGIIGAALFELSKYALIAVAIFFVAYREKLFNIKGAKLIRKDMIVGGALFLVFEALFLLSRFLTNYRNLSSFSDHLTLLFIMKYIGLLGAAISLAVAIYGFKFLIGFFKDFWKQIVATFVMTAIVYNMVIFIRGAWMFLSKIVTISVAFLLALTFPEVRYSLKNPAYPSLVVGDFGVLIGSPCSGIDGMSLFSMLFIMIIVFDWSRINKLKAFIIFPFGVIGMYCVNILRVYSLMIVGKTISKEFAIGAFHSNIGWILFITYFLSFLYFVYPYLTKSGKLKVKK